MDVAYSRSAQARRAYELDSEALEAAKAARAELLREIDLLIRKHRPLDATEGDVKFACGAASDLVSDYFADTINRLERECDPWAEVV